MTNQPSDRTEPSLFPESATDVAPEPGSQAPAADIAAQPSGTESAAPGSPEEEIAALHAEIAELKAQVSEGTDRYLRVLADMENVRRRAADDVSKAHKFSIESFAESLLPVMDSLEMSLKVETPTVESLREGSETTIRQLANAFERNRVVQINPVGEKFDPNRHQAISMVPAASVNPPVPANHVATVLQKGYLINERVLRPAMVMVVQG
ncbi:MAG: nucleotide exchange factor GrpE [Burkholderiaceae bacterium]